jgi:hypothetical protein
MESRAIVVLGMHRSGTSCLAGCLQQADVFFGDVVMAARHNKKGNREKISITKLNDAVLAANGGAWHHPPARVSWTGPLEKRRDEILREFNGRPLWGFKDPRTLLTLGGWIGWLPDVRFVATFRHPVDVAKSLNAREREPRISVEQGIKLWFHYNSILRKLMERQPMPLISFDLLPGRYREKLRRMFEQLGLEPGKVTFFEEALRHQKRDGQPADSQPPSPEVMELYEWLVSRS